MKTPYFTAFLALFSAYLSLAAGPCTPTAVYVCPAGTYDDATGTGNCVSDPTSTSPLAPAPAIGTPLSSFYLMGYDAGFTLGNGTPFSTIASTTQTIIPDSVATFAAGPLPGATIGSITESFTAAAVYTGAQALANNSTLGYATGISTFDAISGVVSTPDGTSGGLTGYTVAVGYALTTSGNVVGLIARYTPRGLLDPNFNNGTGYLLGNPGGFTGGSFSMFTSVAIDSQGNIIVGGYSNTVPTISNTSGTGFLKLLQSKDWNPFVIAGENTGVGGEILANVARYTPLGTLDMTFNTAMPGVTCPTTPDPQKLSACAASGWAVNGFATSPAGGFFLSQASGAGYYGYWDSVGIPFGYRFDVVNGVAVDAHDGIYAVGAAGYFNNDISVAGYSDPFIAHYSQSGQLDAVLNGNNSGDGDFASTNEAFTSVTADIDIDGTQIIWAAGISGGNGPVGNGGSAFSPLVASFVLSNAGLSTETLTLDSTFNSVPGGTPGYITVSPVGTSDMIKSVALDSGNGQLVLVGQESYSAVHSCAMLLTVPTNGDHTRVSYQNSGACTATNYSSGTKSESFHSVAVTVTANDLAESSFTTRYIAVGTTTDASNSRTRSLIASFSPPAIPGTSTIAHDATFASSPYFQHDNSALYTDALPPFFGSSAQLTASYPGFTSYVTGSQVGPDSVALGGGFGGGTAEQFNAVATSPDGQSAIVVGFTTDYPGTSPTGGLPSDVPAAPLSGRSFPIILNYGKGIDWLLASPTDLSGYFGVFPNYGDSSLLDYTDYYYLQLAF